MVGKRAVYLLPVEPGRPEPDLAHAERGRHREPGHAWEAAQARESSDGRTVYFVRGAIAPGLWSVPVSGGPETFVVRDVQEGSWDLTDKGVFFLPRALAIRPLRYRHDGREGLPRKVTITASFRACLA
jgi:hypothetical protein